MSFFGDIAKAAKKGFKAVKKFGGTVAKATREIRPIIGAAGPIGAGVATGLAALDPGEQREARRSGRPARAFGVVTPSFVRASQRLLTRGATAGVRLAQGRLEPTGRTSLRTPSQTPAFQRTVPGRALAATVGQPQRPTAMPLQRRVIQAQPAVQLQVPPLVQRGFQGLQALGGAISPFRGGAPATTRQIVPLSESVDKIGRPLIVAPEAEQRVRCPSGYLAVTMPDGSRACVLAGVAIAAGLAKRRRKPLISVKETRAMQVADRARGKLKRVTQKAGFQVREKTRTVRRKHG